MRPSVRASVRGPAAEASKNKQNPYRKVDIPEIRYCKNLYLGDDHVINTYVFSSFLGGFQLYDVFLPLSAPPDGIPPIDQSCLGCDVGLAGMPIFHPIPGNSWRWGDGLDGRTQSGKNTS